MTTQEEKQEWLSFTSHSVIQNHIYRNRDIWYHTFERLNSFINIHQRLPNIDSDISSEKFLAKWVLQCQTVNNENSDLTNKWNEFIHSDKYYVYFMTSKELWNYKCNRLKDFVKKYNKLPSRSSTTSFDEKELYDWMMEQIYKHEY